MKSHRIASLLVVGAIFAFAWPARATLIGYYPLNGNLNDASGSGNNGVAGPTAPAFGPGRLPGTQGAVFSGSIADQFFTVPINLNALDQVTFGAWVKVTTNDDLIHGIISNDTGNFGRTIDIDTRVSTYGLAAFDGNGVFGGVTPSGGFDFVAVVYNHSAGTQTFYVNGQRFSANGTPPTGETDVTIGRNPNFDNPFGGTIQDAFFYDTALSAAQIANIQANGITVSPGPSTVALPPAAWTTLAMLIAMGVFQAARRRAYAA